MVTFSVIIPTYNRAYLIGNAIKSVLNQTYSDWELIIVDDGSIDNTKEVVDAFIDADKRIKYFYKENGGQNSALNFGWARAEGKYVTFLDSDDTWLETKLDKVLQKYNADEQIGCVYHWRGRISDCREKVMREDTLEGWIYKEVLTQGYMTSPTALSCKRECIDVIGKLEEHIRCCQDDDMCFLLTKNFKVGLIKEVLCIMGDSATERVTDNLAARARNYWKQVKKYEQDVLVLCGSNKMLDRCIKGMSLYCRAKLWRDAGHAKKYSQRYSNTTSKKLKVKIIFIYEMLKSISGYTSFIYWYRKRIQKCKNKRNSNG